MTEKQYYTRDEIIDRVIEVVEYIGVGDVIEIDNISQQVVNDDYYVIYSNDVEQALTQYGIAKAYYEVTDYLNEVLGSIEVTDLQPFKVANILFCIKGEEFIYTEFYDILYRWDGYYNGSLEIESDAQLKDIVNKLKEMKEVI